MADGTIRSVLLDLNGALSRTTPVCGQRSSLSTAAWALVAESTLLALMLVYFSLYTLPAAWPAGYHFTLLILPACLMWNAVEKRGSLSAVATL